MSATRTYSPSLPKIPAGDIFCANPCGPREPDPCPHTYGVRVCSCAAVGIAHRPFRHTRSHPRPTTTTVWRNLQQHPRCDGATTTLNSPLSTLNSSHTFSAKERDSETGLSYFGARYYSSDLSIWLSVDPMASKYPGLSPYTYCADNPVKLVDPNGEKVKPTLAFQNSAYNQVFQNLAQTNTTYQRIISKYQDNNHDFILDYSTELTSKAGSNQMSYTIKAGKITYTKANSKYYRPNGGDQCEIAMVKTLLHEAVHAEDGLSRRKTPSHNGFDQSSVLSGLIEYNSTYNLGYSTEELEILSWSGLEESEEYKDFIERRATINKRTFEEEKNYVETANTLLMYGGSLDD